MGKSDVFSPYELDELRQEFLKAEAHARWTARKFYCVPNELGIDRSLAGTEFQLARKVRDALAARLVRLGETPKKFSWY